MAKSKLSTMNKKYSNPGKPGGFEYKTVNTRTEQGIKQAEKLKEEGWRIISSGTETIQFEREKKYSAGGKPVGSTGLFEKGGSANKSASREEVSKLFTSRFPQFELENIEEFFGKDEDGKSNMYPNAIWLKGADKKIDKGGKSEKAFDYYNKKYPGGVNKSIATFLSKHGWAAVFYDPGTVFLVTNDKKFSEGGKTEYDVTQSLLNEFESRKSSSAKFGDQKWVNRIPKSVTNDKLSFVPDFGIHDKRYSNQLIYGFKNLSKDERRYMIRGLMDGKLKIIEVGVENYLLLKSDKFAWGGQPVSSGDVEQPVYADGGTAKPIGSTGLFARGGRLKKVRVFNYKELDDAAQQKAREHFADTNVFHDWWDGVYEDAKRSDIDITSFDIDRGDIEGEFTDSAFNVATSIMKEHGEQSESYKIAKAYLDEYDKVLDEEDDMDEIDNDFQNDILQEYLSILRKEYEYLTSKEAIEESIIANEYEFLEDGSVAKFALGGKPIGSTGLFAKGGSVKGNDLPQTVYVALYELNTSFNVDNDIYVEKKSDGAIEVKDVIGKVIILEPGSSGNEKVAFSFFSKNELKTSISFKDHNAYDDYNLAHDVELFADNDADLYRQRKVPIIKNLKKKLNKGTFDENLAAVIWKYYVEDADKRYQKQIIGQQPKGYVLSVNDRKLLSQKYAAWTKAEWDANKFEGYAKGGSVEDGDIDSLFIQCTNEGSVIMDEFIDENNGFGYENYYEKKVEDNDTKHSSGYIPLQEGGATATWFERTDSLNGMGKRLPTDKLQAFMEKMVENAYTESQDKFKKEYPEIVEAIGEDKINYQDLYDEGYGSEAERLSEWEGDYLIEETIMMQVGFLLYSPKNSRSEDGKPTCVVQGLVNMESPYHRPGKFENYVEQTFTFHNIDGFKKKLAKALEVIKSWFNGEKRDSGQEMTAGRGFAKGGMMDTLPYKDLPDDEFARGGAIKIANADASHYVEMKTPFRGANLEGKQLDNDDYVVLSYGHYPIWWYCKEEDKWYGNSDKYSVTTSKQMSQSRPGFEVTMLPHAELTKKMIDGHAKFDLGGVMIRELNPMTTDNTLGAHAGSPLPSQNVV